MEFIQSNENVNSMKINDDKYVDVTQVNLKFKFDKEVWISIQNINGDTRFYYEVSCLNNVRNILNEKKVKKIKIDDEEYVTLYKKNVKVVNLFNDNFKKLLISLSHWHFC